MYQSSRSPAPLLGLSQLLSEIGHYADEDDLFSVCQLHFHLEGALMKIFLKRSSIVEYGISLLFSTPGYDILQSGAAVAMFLVLGGYGYAPGNTEAEGKSQHFCLSRNWLVAHYLGPSRNLLFSLS